MGKRGPKPTSAAAKKLDNPGKRPIAEPGAFACLDCLPAPPARLGDDAKQLWKAMGQRLVEQQMLAPTDLVGLEVYCAAWQDYLDADEDIRTQGYTAFTDKGYEYQRPAVNRRAIAMKHLKEWGSRFGFSPLDRTGVELPIRNEIPQGLDPLSDALPAKPNAPRKAK